MSQLNGPHKVVTVTLYGDIKTQALIYCMVSGFSSSDRDFVSTHDRPLHKLKKSNSVRVINGREIEGESIEYLVRIPFRIVNHWKELLTFVTT